MLSKLTNILFGDTNKVNEKDTSKIDLPLASKTNSKDKSLVALNEFFASIKDIGHPEYPILDKIYAPNSRVPCTDLVPFISDRIRENDIDSVIHIMRCVTEGNAEFSIGTGWIEEGIKKILSVPFEKYVSFKSMSGLSELQALFIIAAKGGGGGYFLITQEIPRLFAWNSIVSTPLWSSNLQSLVTKANSWISDMAKDIPYWKEYERFVINKLPASYIEYEMNEKILSLTPAARLQLFYAVEKGGGALFSMTNGLTSGPIRSLGINEHDTSQELLSSGLIISSSSQVAIEAAHSKQELISFCESFGVIYRKSWNKKQLVAALAKKDLEILENISISNKVVAPNIQLYPELINIVHIADEHEIGFKLLCFA